MLPEWKHAWRTLIGRPAADASLDGELEYHLEKLTEEKIRQGLDPAEARYAARREFGGVTQHREAARDAWGAQWIESIGRDAWIALRQLARQPGYTAAAALTLALGLGANIAVFTVLHALVLRPLPYRDSDRLVRLRSFDQRGNRPNIGFSVLEIEDLRKQATSFEDLAEQHVMTFTLLGKEVPETVATGVVSANLFEFLGVRALHGRAFAAGEDAPGAEPVMVLSYRYFQSGFGGDPGVVGRKVRLNDRPHTIVGVLPPLPEFPVKIDVYMPVSSCPTRSAATFLGNRRARMMDVFTRLKPGVTPAQAQAELDSLARRMRGADGNAYPQHEQWGFQPLRMEEELAAQARPTFLLLFGATALVLLIACANVANLTLSRALRRRREIAVRAALGASRGRLLQQFLIEGLLVSFTGAAIGVLAARASLGMLAGFAGRFSLRAHEITIDWTVLAFAALAAAVTGVVACALPALRGPADLTNSIKDGSASATSGAGKSRLRGALVAAQVAFSVMLLIGAGLLLRSFFELLKVDMGARPERVITMTLSPNWTRLNATQDFQRFFERLVERAREIPGITAAGVGARIPLNQRLPFTRAFLIEGQAPNPESQPVLDLATAGPGYFDALGVRLVAGRDFTDADREKAPQVAIVNQRFARRYWPAQDAIGRRVSLDNGDTWITVAGVIADVKNYGLAQEATEELYRPFAQAPNGINIVARTAGDPGAAIQQLRRAVYELNPEQAVTQIRTLEEVRGENLAAPRLTASLLSLLAALTLLVTVTGIAGVAVLTVGQRKKEIGIRIALGARPGRVVRDVVSGELRMVVLGLVVGLAGAAALARLLDSFLFRTPARDWLTFGAAAVVLLAVAALACFGPARRAALANPLTVLRGDS